MLPVDRCALVMSQLLEHLQDNKNDIENGLRPPGRGLQVALFMLRHAYMPVHAHMYMRACVPAYRSPNIHLKRSLHCQDRWEESEKYRKMLQILRKVDYVKVALVLSSSLSPSSPSSPLSRVYSSVA